MNNNADKRKLTWNEEVVAWIVIQLSKGKTWKKIAKSYNRKYKHNTTGNYLYTKYKQTLLTGKVVTHKAHLTPEEEVFLTACFLNNFSVFKTINGFKEQFGVEISQEQLFDFQKKLVIEEKIQHENKVEKQIKKKVRKMNKKIRMWTTEEKKGLMKCKNRKQIFAYADKIGRSQDSAYTKWYKTKRDLEEVKRIEKMAKNARKKYTKKENQMISNCKSAKEAEGLSLTLNRTPSALNRQWYIVREKETARTKWNTKERKPKKPESKENREMADKLTRRTYTPRWKPSQDFDLLCNFYELSIDEARKRYKRTYSQIAGRLESLVDSTKPEHISMLMKAAEAIKLRKEQDAKPVKLSRKEKRMAKKQAKKDKKIAKAQAKLDKMRGE